MKPNPPQSTPALNGELIVDGQFAQLFYRRHFPHAPTAVWHALTDPVELGRWMMASSVRIDGRDGGAIEMVAGISQLHSRGTILHWEPPCVLEYEWNVDPRAELPSGERTVVRWELKATAQGTELRLTHRRLTKPTALGFAPGWHVFLDRLAARLDGASLPDWLERFRALQPTYPSWSS